jgi:hypothetical protein
MDNSYTLFSEMVQVKDRVRLLLGAHPHLRDNDYKLYSTFIAYQIGGVDKLKEMSGYALLTDIANGKYVHFESVRRIRARIQEQDPELRGENYYKRKKGGEITAKNISEL